VAAWHDQQPKAGAAHGHVAMAHLAKPTNVPSVCTRVVTTIATGVAAQVPPVDRWPRVTAAAVEAPRGLRVVTEVLRWSPAEEKRLVTRRHFLKNTERGERVTGVGKLTKNPHGCTVHHGGERFKSVWLTTLGRGRCSSKAGGGRRAPVWLLGGGGEVARQAAVGNSSRR
jgi:hypothetical protein